MPHGTKSIALLIVALFWVVSDSLHAEHLGRRGYVDSGGVKLHNVTAGEGPLVVMIHGFPDYRYTWRNQMPALAEHFQVVAYDQRRIIPHQELTTPEMR